MTTHPNGLRWSLYAADALPLWQRWQVRAHLRRCAHCRQQAELIRNERAAHAASAVYGRTLANLRAHATVREGQRRPLWPWLGMASATLATAATVLVVGVLRPEPGLRAKGEADTFALFVSRSGTATPLGSQGRAGDSLRARYRSSKSYLLVVEMDGSGHGQVVFPEGATQSGRIDATSALTPGSWVLDGTPGEERFVALFSDAPLEAGAVLRSLARGDVPAASEVHTVERVCSKTP